jgi:hypothetical protein
LNCAAEVVVVAIVVVGDVHGGLFPTAFVMRSPPISKNQVSLLAFQGTTTDVLPGAAEPENDVDEPLSEST